MTTHLRSRDPGPELRGLARTLDRAAEYDFDLGAVRLGIDGLVVHRRRRRRQLTSAAAAAAAALVVGGSTWLLAPGRDLGTAATPVPPPTAAPTESSVVVEPSSIEPPSSPDPSTPVQFDVPDAAMLTMEQVGQGRQGTVESSQYGNQPAAIGQYCDTSDTGASGPAPVAGRQRSWSSGASDFDGQVEIVVTGWESGTGASAFTDVVEDTGRCVWLDPVVAIPRQGWRGDEGYLVSGAPVFGNAAVVAVQRVGDVLVGVTAYDSAGEAEAAAEAVRLSDLVVDELVASGLPQTGR